MYARTLNARRRRRPLQQDHAVPCSASSLPEDRLGCGMLQEGRRPAASECSLPMQLVITEMYGS